jgi:hypothetical protein
VETCLGDYVPDELTLTNLEFRDEVSAPKVCVILIYYLLCP